MQWKPHSCILTCPEHKFKSWIELIKFNIFAQSVFKQVCSLHNHIANWRLRPQGAKGRDRGPIRDFATFAYQHTLRSLKSGFKETWISSKKRKKMLSSYGEIALRRIKSIESIKNVIHIMGLAFSLVCMQRDWNQAE